MLGLLGGPATCSRVGAPNKFTTLGATQRKVNTFGTRTVFATEAVAAPQGRGKSGGAEAGVGAESGATVDLLTEEGGHRGSQKTATARESREAGTASIVVVPARRAGGTRATGKLLHPWT